MPRFRGYSGRGGGRRRSVRGRRRRGGFRRSSSRRRMRSRGVRPLRIGYRF